MPSASRVVSSKGITGEKYAEPNGTASMRLRAHIRNAAGMDLRKVCKMAAGAVGVPSLDMLGDAMLASSSLSSATIDPTTAEKDTLLFLEAAPLSCLAPPLPLLRRMGVSSSNDIMPVTCSVFVARSVVVDSLPSFTAPESHHEPIAVGNKQQIGWQRVGIVRIGRQASTGGARTEDGSDRGVSFFAHMLYVLKMVCTSYVTKPKIGLCCLSLTDRPCRMCLRIVVAAADRRQPMALLLLPLAIAARLISSGP